MVLPFSNAASVAGGAAARGVGVHLDGARLFNAVVASGRSAAELAEHADTAQICLSKGLRAPIGSLAVGTGRLIARVRRARRMLGGGMRQAGIVAAAGIVALEEMVDRLADDHANAARLAAGLAELPGVVVEPEPATKIVLFRLPPQWTVDGFAGAAQAAGVALAGFGHGRVRAVTHADVDAGDVDAAVELLAKVLTGRPA